MAEWQMVDAKGHSTKEAIKLIKKKQYSRNYDTVIKNFLCTKKLKISFF